MKSKQIIHATLALTIAIFLCGCSSTSYGTKIERSKVEQIQKGVTTRAQVEALLGPPTQVTLSVDGGRIMSYSFHETTAQAKPITYVPYVGLFAGGAKGQTRSQMLQINLNRNNVVVDYEFNDGTNVLDSSSGGLKSTTTPAVPK